MACGTLWKWAHFGSELAALVQVLPAADLSQEKEVPWGGGADTDKGTGGGIKEGQTAKMCLLLNLLPWRVLEDAFQGEFWETEQSPHFGNIQAKSQKELGYLHTNS